MMIAREADDGTTTTKQEGNSNTAADHEKNNINISKASSSSTSLSSSWSRLKDPRIVRVSRAFGGKDRHSKVCTVRGLRDRRVRLSVPTAIQLYDLQDRLGLNQPSKVVDWLLNAAKHEIDELPPLQMPPGGNFSQNLQPSSAVASASQSSRGLIKIGNSSSINWDDHHHPTDVPSGSNNTWNKAKEAAAAARDHQSTNDDDKEITWTRRNHEEEKQSQFEDINHGVYVSSSNNFFSRHSTHSSTHGLGNLLNNSGQPNYGSLVRWDPSTLSLAQSGSPGLTVLPQPSEDFHNFNVVSLASGANPQVLVYHQPPGDGGGSGGIAQSYFPPQINFQMMLNSNSDHNSLTPPTNDDSGSQQGRPFHLMTTTTTTTTNFLPMQKERGNE